MSTVYPTLAGEIAKRGIRKTVIARQLGISERAFYNKLSGSASFTWDEVCFINKNFFPDIEPAMLFARADQRDSA